MAKVTYYTGTTRPYLDLSFPNLNISSYAYVKVRIEQSSGVLEKTASVISSTLARVTFLSTDLVAGTWPAQVVWDDNSGGVERSGFLIEVIQAI